MDVTCPRCHSRHHVDAPASRTRARPLRFRCSECGNTFPLHGEGSPLPPAMLPIEPPSRLEPQPRVVSSGEPVEMLRVGGDVYSVPDLATLQRWVLEQRVSRSDMVSQHGMRWTALGDRPDFAVFFTAAESLGGQTGSAPPAAALSHRHLPMADDEEIYVQEVNPGDVDAPTVFVGTAPPPEAGLPEPKPPAPRPEPRPAPTLAPDEDPPGLPPPVPASLAFPRTDEPTQAELRRPRPLRSVDELPADLIARTPPGADEPETLLTRPPLPDMRAEARVLGFQLGPDPDTQEATMEQTVHSLDPVAAAVDPTDAFMRGASLDDGMGDPAPPPVVLPGGRIPVTVAPQEPSPLDDDFAEAEPPSRLPMSFTAAAALLLVVAGGAWWMSRASDAEAPELPALAERSPPATPEVAQAEVAQAEVAQAEVAQAEVAKPDAAGEPSELAAVRGPDPEAAKAEAAKAEAAKAEAAKAEAAKAEAAKAEAAKVAAAKAEAAKAEAAKVAAAKAEAAKAAKAQTAAARPAPSAKAEAAPKAEPKPAGGSARSLADQGWKAMDKGDVEGAHGLFSRALQKDPGASWALYGRGYANEKLGDKVSARSDYCAALSAAGTDTELARELAGGLRRLGAGC